MSKIASAFLKRLHTLATRKHFKRSGDYWERRYLAGGTSGSGSYGRLALFKATALNSFVAKAGVQTVIELGCGDGGQLELAQYPSYLGIDVSPAAVAGCKRKFADDPAKSFALLHEFRRNRPVADLALSLDVVYHLVEDEAFEPYMHDLFGAATRFVAIYSSNSDHIVDPAPHVRHRAFTSWVQQNEPTWRLSSIEKNPYPRRWWNRHNTSNCDLFFYERL
jgi:hypothetical protein